MNADQQREQRELHACEQFANRCKRLVGGSRRRMLDCLHNWRERNGAKLRDEQLRAIADQVLGVSP